MTDKMQIFPSRANAVLMKQKILAAKRGMSLLKRKRDAIDLKLREIRALMSEKEELVDNMMRTAIFSVAKANLLGTDFKPVIVADSRVATAYMHKRQQKLVGITLNFFELEVCAQGAFPLAGLTCGGQQVQKVRKYFQQALKEIVEFASYEYMLRMMVLASRQTNMRVNALDFVVIPRLINTSRYIDGELEEFEREDFYRLKRSQAKQLEAKIAFTELIKTKNMTADELAAYIKRGGFAHPVADVAFDVEAFESESLEERMRRAFLKRESQKRTSFHDDEHSDGEERRSHKEHHDRQAGSLFSQRTMQRDSRASRASFYALPALKKTASSTTTSSSSASSASNEEPSNDDASKADDALNDDDDAKTADADEDDDAKDDGSDEEEYSDEVDTKDEVYEDVSIKDVPINDATYSDVLGTNPTSDDDEERPASEDDAPKAADPKDDTPKDDDTKKPDPKKPDPQKPDPRNTPKI